MAAGNRDDPAPQDGCGKTSLPAMNMALNGSSGSSAGPRKACDSAGRAMLSGPRSVPALSQLASKGEEKEGVCTEGVVAGAGIRIDGRVGSVSSLLVSVDCSGLAGLGRDTLDLRRASGDDGSGTARDEAR